MKKSVVNLIGKVIFFLLSNITVGLCKFLSVIAKTNRNITKTSKNTINCKPNVFMKLLDVKMAKLVACIAIDPFSN